MKTQDFGTSPPSAYYPRSPSLIIRLYSIFRLYVLSLKNYRENRENGLPQDNPVSAFPSAGLDVLDIKDSWQGSAKWPDAQGRYWWKLTLQNGQVINDFYWMKDKARGWPDKDNCYWFTVYHAPSGTKIEGFSQEPNREKGFPEKGTSRYWYNIKYTECGAIKE
jgi:hypothetical protein